MKIGNQTTHVTDWEIDKVERGKNGILEEFVATFTSDSIKSVKYKDGDMIEITIHPLGDDSLCDAIVIKYKVQITKVLLVFSKTEFIKVE